MSTLTKKAVYDGAERIGEAATKGEVAALLIARGSDARAADDTIMTRCVETPTRFHLVTPGPMEAMMAELRSIK